MADATLIVKILTDAKGAMTGVDQASSKMTKFKGAVSTAAKGAAVGLLGVAAAGVKAAQAAAEDEQSQTLLAKSMTNAAGASKKQIAATEDWIGKMALATGVADDELRPALGSLVRATGDVALSQKALKTAMDVSAATGKPLQAVSDAMAKGYGGQTTALGRLVPGMDKALLKSGDMNKIMAELARTTGGSAAAAADTAAGKMQRMKVAMGEAQESLGAALLPLMGKLATILGKVAAWTQKNTLAVQILVGVFVVAAVAVMALNVALMIMAANPVTLIIIGIVAAVALLAIGFAILWKRSETFRKVVTAVFKAVRAVVVQVARDMATTFRAAWSAISAAARAFMGVARAVFNAVRTAVNWVSNAVRSLGSWFGRLRVPVSVRNAVNAIRTAVSWAIDKVRDLGSWLGKLRMPGGLASALDGVKNAAKWAADAVKSLWSWLGKLHVPKLSFPKIPHGLSIVSGAASTPFRVSPTVRGGVGAPIVPMSSGGGGGVTINISGALDPEATARQVVRLLDGHYRRVGTPARGLRTA